MGFIIMARHSHTFVETYQGLMAFGLDQQTDKNTLICYLQKFSDDLLIRTLVERMSEAEREELFAFISRLLKKYLSHSEYHELFSKED